MLKRTYNTVLEAGFHFSSAAPYHVPNKLRQTFPSLYKLGLNLNVPPPLVNIFISGGAYGYVS